MGQINFSILIGIYLIKVIKWNEGNGRQAKMEDGNNRWTQEGLFFVVCVGLLICEMGVPLVTMTASANGKLYCCKQKDNYQ